MKRHTHRSHKEPHAQGSGGRLNWIRASVLGANDGIVSLAGIVVGVAGASASTGVVFLSGISGLAAGALSMAVGEYISVSSQRDTEHALLAKERHELTHEAEAELDELIGMYENKGLSHDTAVLVARELTAHDDLRAHADIELGINPDELARPVQAAVASAVSFSAGAVIPLLAITLSPVASRLPVTFVAVTLALILTAVVSARVTGAPLLRVLVRVLLGGLLAMVITLSIGFSVARFL